MEKPTLQERAEIAASVAASLPRGPKEPVNRWTAFYRDLVSFMEGSSSPLVGRQMILCGDHTLRAGRRLEAVNAESGLKSRRRRRRDEKVEASLFFPPAPRATSNGDNDGLKVPRRLKEYFAFASDALPWHGTLKPAREFLEGTLVTAYDSETVLTRISQVVNGGASVEEAIAGLRWAFAIWRRAGGGLFTNRRNYRLLVPTAEQELIPATEAVFSESWPDHRTLGKHLKRFLDAAPPVPDIVDLGRRRLAPISHRAFGKARIAEWVEFLSALGVRRGLVAVKKTAGRSFRANELTSFSFCKEVGISDTAAKTWKADVEKFVHGGASFSWSTRYNFKGSLWWLPGQADHESFSNDCRELYAELIVDWLERAPEALFSVEIAHTYYSDTRRWPTPAAAFLRSANWMPADDPQVSDSVRDHFSPSDVWIPAVGERFPYYLRQPAVALAKAIERVGDTGRDRLVKRAGLRVLGGRSTFVEQARFLADQFRRGTVNRHYEPQFVNLYNSTWKRIADRHAAEPTAFSGVTAPPILVVRRGGVLLAAVPGGADTPPIYVRDNEDEIAVALINATGGAILDVKGADRRRIGALFSTLYGTHVRLGSQLRYDVRADGTRIEELPRERTVLEICPLLRLMAAVAIEGLKGIEASQLPADRSSFLARLGSVRIGFAGAVVFELDSTTISPDRRAYLFRGADGTALVIALHAGPPNWTLVEDCLQVICDAIDLPQIATRMRLLARELAGTDIGAREIEPADLNRLARSLYLDDDACLAARHLLSDRLDASLPWIEAFVHLTGGPDAVEAFDRIRVDAGDPEVMRTALEPLLAPTAISPDAVIDASRRSFTIEQFRERLNIELADFNASLIAIGVEPETYPQLHADQLLHYVAKHEFEIILALRNAVAPKLERYEAAPEYVRFRDEIRLMATDPAWLQLYKTVPDELVAARVEAWLAAAGAPPLGANPHGLSKLQTVRKANLAAAAKFAVVAAPLVRTWCAARGRAAPDAWADPYASDEKLRAALDAAGAMDFRELDEATLLAWSTTLGLWPADMDRTLDRAALGIAATDIEAANARAREEAERRAANERSVRFDGHDEDPKTTDWTNLSDVIAAKLPKKVKRTALGAFSSLAPVVKPEGSTGSSPARRPGDAAPRVPPAKTEMIGRLGELVVYHWLKELLPNQDIDAAWVSKNGDRQLGRSAGSDDLGFDFRVDYRRQTWQIEVKASVGDQQRFDMGETEVRAAREAARPRSNTRYVIVYVANPQDPANVRIDVLPNPMSTAADGVLELLGEGVRFGFKRQ